MSLEALARAANLRDLGGRPSADGRYVRRGVLYRSGSLARLARRERAALDDLGLRTIVDLRTDAEVARHGAAPCPRGGRVVRLPIDSGDLTSTVIPKVLRGDFDAIPPDFLAQVNRHLVRHARAPLREALALVADASARPLLFHCTHGKDRTGVLAAVVLLALDVPWDDVLRDYLSSNDFPTTQHRRQVRALRLLAPLLTRRLFRRPDLGPAEGLFRVVPENLEAARDEMRLLHGSEGAYLDEALGLGEARRHALHAELLVSM